MSLLGQTLEEFDHDLVAPCGDTTARLGEKTIFDAGELDDKLVDGRVTVWIIALRHPAIEVDGCHWDPESLSVGSAVSESSRYTYRPDSVKLVSIKEHLCL